MSKKTKFSVSFSMKKNLGNYETADWWMSQEVECDEGEVEEVSEKTYEFIKGLVVNRLKRFNPIEINEYGHVPTTVEPKKFKASEEEIERLKNFKAKYPKLTKVATDKEGGYEYIDPKNDELIDIIH